MPHLLHQNLELTAAKHPDKVALISDQNSITYSALNESATAVSGFLDHLKVQPGDLVAVLMPKDIQSIIAVNGIMKTGAAYVPIDPNFPSTRVGFLLENCDVKCLITYSALFQKNREVIESNGLTQDVILCDQTDLDGTSSCNLHAWQDVLASGYAQPQIDITANDLAYLLFTSGSTGIPKGVMTSHQNAISFVDSMQDLFSVDSDDVIANPAPLQFGISTFDMYVGTKAGATVRLVPPNLVTFPQELARWFDEEGITTWFSVPFVLSRMLLEGEIQNFRFEKLRRIFFAGEVFPVKYLRSLKSAWSHVHFCNIYGTSEANIITYHPVGDLPEDRTKPIPIGRPIPNLNVFVMKEDGSIADTGEEGELCTHGLMVTHGYWKDPERTLQNYIQNPLQCNFREIGYKTGDLVIKDEEGNYHYVGRKDHMIKSRGYRIEIGDIEAAIYSHKAIKEATVTAVPDDLVGHRIKAFVSLHQQDALDAMDIQEHCSHNIPRYMIPEEIEILDALPKTVTGKIDKAFLKSKMMQE